MKTKLSVLLVIVCCASYTVAQIVPGDVSTYPSQSVVNTPHNLNNYPGVNIPGNQICLPCHIPHNAQTPELGQRNLLWNHAESDQTFVMFKSSAGQPQGTSKLCLSCHDGVTAVDSYGGNIGSTPITGAANLGTDLTNDHPIGIEYPTTYIGQRWRDPATFAPGINGGSGVRLVTIDGLKRVECNSCHNAHNNGLGNFLRVPIEESYLCLQCHIK
jgi:predicted CXXCH cytochrome family protein